MVLFAIIDKLIAEERDGRRLTVFPPIYISFSVDAACLWVAYWRIAMSFVIVIGSLLL